MNAIILDGEFKSALTALRALGKTGVHVSVGAVKGSAMALASRYARRRFVYRSPLKDPDGFLADLARELEKSDTPPILYAFSDATAILLSRNRGLWEGRALMPLPPEVSVETAFDKRKTIELARSLSIPTPPTWFLDHEDDIDRVLGEISVFPVVVKPRTSVSWKGGAGTSGSVLFAFTKEEARKKIHEIHTRTGMYPLIETYLSGGEFGFEALCHRGELLAYMAHRRIRSLSPTGGASVLKETIEPSKELFEHSHALLKALSWTGPAMVEWKQDANGTYQLLEINGRFWGSLPLPVRAGLDFPNRYRTLALGRIEDLRVLTKDDYERNVRSRHFLGDVLHLLRVFFKHDSMRRIAYPSRTEALRAFFAPHTGVRSDVFSWSDPFPSIMEVVSHL